MKSPELNDYNNFDVSSASRRPPPPPPLVSESVFPQGALQVGNHCNGDAERPPCGSIQVRNGNRHIDNVEVEINQNSLAKLQNSRKKLIKTHLTVGMRLKKWIITERIGAGSFGEVFAAAEEERDGETSQVGNSSQVLMTSRTQKKDVCIKVAQEGQNLLRLEAAILKKLQPCPQIVRYISSGCAEGVDFLVMQRLGANLAVLRRSTRSGTFSPYTTLKLGISCLRVIQDVHAYGFVHRDVKPSNFVLGSKGTPDTQLCYLIDFGLARRYRRANNEVRQARKKAGFRGTSRYASLASHYHHELGRVDDLWSLLFMLIEFVTGTLPWRKFKEKEDIGRCKEAVIGPSLVRHLPREFRPFLMHLQTLRYEDEPNYEFLISLLERSLERRGHPPDKRLDWEIEENLIEPLDPEESKKKHVSEHNPEQAQVFAIKRLSSPNLKLLQSPSPSPPPPQVADARPKRPPPAIEEIDSIQASKITFIPAMKSSVPRTEDDKEYRNIERVTNVDEEHIRPTLVEPCDIRAIIQNVKPSSTVSPMEENHAEEQLEGLQQNMCASRSSSKRKSKEKFSDSCMTVEDQFSPREELEKPRKLCPVFSNDKESKPLGNVLSSIPSGSTVSVRNETQENGLIQKRQWVQTPVVSTPLQKKTVTFAVGDTEVKDVKSSSLNKKCKKNKKQRSKVNCNCVVL